MSQRNPMNDRYQSEDRKGLTRKSAASLKPKSKAAASVRIETKTKTPQQKKAEKKAERAKQAELDRQYYNPPTEEYKRLRKAWWILLIAAILCTALSWVARAWEPAWISLAALALAYVFIIAAFYVDFSKIRKCRRAYQAEMMASKSKKSAKADDKEKANGKEKASDKEKEAAAASDAVSDAASDAASDAENNSIIARLRSKHTKAEGSSEAEATSVTDEKE